MHPAGKSSHGMMEGGQTVLAPDLALEGEEVECGSQRTRPPRVHQNYYHHPHQQKCLTCPSRIPTGWKGSLFSRALVQCPCYTRKSKNV